MPALTTCLRRNRLPQRLALPKPFLSPCPLLLQPRTPAMPPPAHRPAACAGPQRPLAAWPPQTPRSSCSSRWVAAGTGAAPFCAIPCTHAACSPLAGRSHPARCFVPVVWACRSRQAAALLAGTPAAHLPPWPPPATLQHDDSVNTLQNRLVRTVTDGFKNPNGWGGRPSRAAPRRALHALHAATCSPTAPCLWPWIGAGWGEHGPFTRPLPAWCCRPSPAPSPRPCPHPTATHQPTCLWHIIFPCLAAATSPPPGLPSRTRPTAPLCSSCSRTTTVRPHAHPRARGASSSAGPALTARIQPCLAVG